MDRKMNQAWNQLTSDVFKGRGRDNDVGEFVANLIVFILMLPVFSVLMACAAPFVGLPALLEASAGTMVLTGLLQAVALHVWPWYSDVTKGAAWLGGLMFTGILVSNFAKR